MLDARELRIGNIVDHITGTITVDCEDLALIEKDSCEYIPIPLTEQWLIDFGFDSLGKFGYGIGQFRLEYSKNLVKNHGVDFVFWIDRSIIPIKHVHQLQNLYFALTGEDLHL